MYVPHHFAVEDETEIRHMVASLGSAELVTTGPDGYPEATLLPIVWAGGRVIAHMARANPHWQHLDDGAPALLIATGPQAYVSPTWYPSKAEHGRVVPTWNYTSVHLAGRVRVHDDVDWLRAAVDDLVERHEAHRPQPWRSSDAPPKFLHRQLRAIVGLEINVERVEAKAKLSQNRAPADRAGVLQALAGESAVGAAAVWAAMAQLADDAEPETAQHPGR